MSHFRIFRFLAVACCCALIGAAPAAAQVFDEPPPPPGQILPYEWNGPDGQPGFFGSAENWLVDGKVPDSPPGENDTVVFDPPAVGKKSAIVELSSPNAPDFEAVVGARFIREGDVVLRDGVLQVVGDGTVGDPSSIIGPMYFVGDELPAVVRHGGNVGLFGGKTIIREGSGYEMDGSLHIGFGAHAEPWFVIREGASAAVGGDLQMDRGLLSLDGGGGIVDVGGDLLLLPAIQGITPSQVVVREDALLRAGNISAGAGVIDLMTPENLPTETVTPCFIEAGKVELGGSALLMGDGAVGTGQLVNGGRIAPGGGVGTLRVEPFSGAGGDYVQTAGGTLEIELGRQSPKPDGGLSDRLEIAGHAQLDGKLVLRAIDEGFRPRPGDQFEVMKFGSHSGDVEVVDETGFKGINFQKVFTKTSLSLRAVAGGPTTPDGGDEVVVGSFHVPPVVEASDGTTYFFSGDAELRVRFVPQSDLIQVHVNFNDVFANDEDGALFRATNHLQHTFDDDGSGVNFAEGSVRFAPQGQGDSIPVEPFITLHFAEIKYEYTEQEEEKTAAGIPMTWEITEGEGKS